MNKFLLGEISRNRNRLFDLVQLFAGLTCAIVGLAYIIVAIVKLAAGSGLDSWLNRIAFLSLALGLLLMMFINLKFRGLYSSSLRLAVRHSHLLIYNTRNVYFHMQRILHKNVYKNSEGFDFTKSGIEAIGKVLIIDNLDSLCSLLTAFSGMNVNASVILFDQYHKMRNVESSSNTAIHDLQLYICHQCTSTPANLVPLLNQKFSIAEEPILQNILENGSSYFFVSNARQITPKVGEQGRFIIGKKELRDYIGSGIIAPIRCPKSLYPEEDHKKKGMQYDYIGFLITYAYEYDVFRSRDREIYAHVVCGAADTLFGVLERIAVYKRHSNDFILFKDAHEKAHISEIFSAS
jgi:hypothetical protein